MSLYNASILPFKEMLEIADKWLEIAVEHAKAKSLDPNDLATASHDGNRTLRDHIQSMADDSTFCAASITGKEAPKHPNTETTIDDLRVRLKSAIAYLDTFTKADFAGADDRPVELMPGKTADVHSLFNGVMASCRSNAMVARAILRRSGIQPQELPDDHAHDVQVYLARHYKHHQGNVSGDGSTELTVVNQSNDTRGLQIVIFQKNISAGLGDQFVAWKVIENLVRGWSFSFLYPLGLTVGVMDSYGNRSPSFAANPGELFSVFEDTSGDQFEFAGSVPNSVNEIWVRNDLHQGGINACIYRDDALLAVRKGVAPDQSAVFEFNPCIYLGVVSNGDLRPGTLFDPTILSSITEISLPDVSRGTNILRGTIILTGGPRGSESPFKFTLSVEEDGSGYRVAVGAEKPPPPAQQPPSPGLLSRGPDLPFPTCAPSSLPVGSITAFAGRIGWPNARPNEDHTTDVEASGWMVCDGRQLACTQFPELFRALGHRYSKREESNDLFRIPDLRGYFLRGADDAGESDSGRSHGSPPSIEYLIRFTNQVAPANTSGDRAGS